MQLEHVRAAGDLVQAVDILRNHAAKQTQRLPSPKRLVCDIRLSLGKVDVRQCFLPPVLDPRLTPREKVVEVDRLRGSPDAAGRAKIRDPTLRTYTGPSEDHRPPRHQE